MSEQREKNLESQKQKSSVYIKQNGHLIGKLSMKQFLRFILIEVFLFLLLGFSFYFLIFNFDRQNSEVVNKQSLLRPISAIIQNGGDLDAIKHVYSFREKERPLIILPKDSYKYYPFDISLTDVLEDLKSGYLSADPFVEDSLFYSCLSAVIRENNYRNPFDNLDQNQRYYFENIRSKAGVNYSDIQNEVSRIADELQSKNQLVDRYLNKSTLSFVLSIIALAFTIVLSIVQIWQNQRTNNTIREYLNKSKDDNIND